MTADMPTPVKVTSLEEWRATTLACGGWHTLVVCVPRVPPDASAAVAESDSSVVFAFGRGEYGRLGLGHSSSVTVPKQIAALNGAGIIQVSCGGTHSMFLDNQGGVWACGRGDHGRLGVQAALTIE